MIDHWYERKNGGRILRRQTLRTMAMANALCTWLSFALSGAVADALTRLCYSKETRKHRFF